MDQNRKKPLSAAAAADGSAQTLMDPEGEEVIQCNKKIKKCEEEISISSTETSIVNHSSESEKKIEYIYIDDNDDDDDDESKNQNDADSQLASLTMNQVERVHVHQPNAKQLVNESRKNGVPLVIVGHIGWVNFAKPWLKKIQRKESGKYESNQLKQDDLDDDKDVDLDNPNYKYDLDIDKMTSDLGNEKVPYSLPDYDEENPISGKLQAKKIFAQFSTKGENRNFPYLSQWQFPLSKTAAKKLCYNCRPLPSGIFGEDLLKYYKGEDLPHCKEDNPYQYLFMGNTGSTTKMHVDRGGLDITIAPIVGEKECTLVHRDDGHDCFYDLDADLDNVNLDKYPLMSEARIWKTVVKPGEILLIPQETYHKCQNLSPCLSYSRLVLDTVNLLPFYRYKKGDESNGIDDMDHEKVLWNCAYELHHKIGDYTQNYKRRGRKRISCTSLLYDIELKVEALQSLRRFLCDLKNRNPNFSFKNVPEYIRSRDTSKNPYEVMVADIDSTLNSFSRTFAAR